MLKLLTYNKTLVFIGVAVLGLSGGAIYIKSFQAPSPKPTEEYRPKADEESASSTNNSTTASPSSSSSNKTVNEPKIEESQNIIVSSPSRNSKIQEGTVVSGKARVFEGRVAYSVKSSSKGVLAHGFTNVEGDHTLLSPFSIALQFETQPESGDSGVLEVFSYSPKDGTEINKVIIPVVF
jgi:cytoskeletal protein RodZ